MQLDTMLFVLHKHLHMEIYNLSVSDLLWMSYRYLIWNYVVVCNYQVYICIST